MSLALYGHPFSSYTQKVLIALYENGTPFESRCLGPDTPQHAAEWQRRWPLRKFPLLVDGERNVVETSIIIEYLQLMHPGPVRFLPTDSMAALEVRFLDRYFDLHVMTPVQHAVGAALTGDAIKREEGLAFAASKLELAYAWLEGYLADRTWLPVGISRWRTVRQLLRCFTLTGRIKFPRASLCFALTASDCLPARPSPGRLRRRDRSGLSFPWERQTATRAMCDRRRSLQCPRIAPFNGSC
jgi:glutathione S-transferase